jgi:hypothetical protein
MKYEYTIDSLNFADPQVLKQILNERGEKGWDLVAIWPDTNSGGIGVFKRPLDAKGSPPVETFAPKIY